MKTAAAIVALAITCLVAAVTGSVLWTAVAAFLGAVAFATAPRRRAREARAPGMVPAASVPERRYSRSPSGTLPRGAAPSRSDSRSSTSDDGALFGAFAFPILYGSDDSPSSHSHSGHGSHSSCSSGSSDTSSSSSSSCSSQSSSSCSSSSCSS